MVDIDAARHALHKWGDLDEIYEVTTFEAARRLSTGQSESVTVKILDGGNSLDPQVRYAVEVTTADGRTVTGNNASSVDKAIAGVQWDALSRPPDDA